MCMDPLLELIEGRAQMCLYLSWLAQDGRSPCSVAECCGPKLLPASAVE